MFSKRLGLIITSAASNGDNHLFFEGGNIFGSQSFIYRIFFCHRRSLLLILIYSWYLWEDPIFQDIRFYESIPLVISYRTVLITSISPFDVYSLPFSMSNWLVGCQPWATEFPPPNELTHLLLNFQSRNL